MKALIYLFVTFAFTAYVNGQEKQSETVFKDAPSAVNEFMKNFPEVKVIDYSDLQNGHYIVDFFDNEKEMLFKIDAHGNSIQKEVEISTSELPEKLHQKLQEQGKLKYAWQIEKKNGEVLYLVEFKKKMKLYEQIYTDNGHEVPHEEYYASLLQ